MPTVVAVTFTFIVQTLAIAMLAFVTDTDVLVDDGTPPQLLTKLGVAAMVRPAGNVSVTFAPVMTKAEGLIKVIVKVAIPPGAMAAGENDLLMLGP